MHFLDFPSLRRLPGVLKAGFFLPKLQFLDFPSLRRLPGVLKAVFSSKIALFRFSQPGGPYLGPYGPYSLLPRWGPGALLGRLFACFFNA